VSRRNTNFKVVVGDGPSYLLKIGPGGQRSTVAREAAVYRALLRAEDGVAAFLPQVYAYEPDEDLLVLELVRDAHDLREHHSRIGRFSKALAAEVGAALGSLHRVTKIAEGAAPHAHPPWALSIHRPDLGVMRESSTANLEVIRIVQRSEGFRHSLERLARDWRVECVIHFDVKWDNFIVPASDGRARSGPLKLIDWELAQEGDPCWDLGSAFAHFLSFWVFSIPVTGETPPQQWPDLARYPLARMRPALTACWTAYRRSRGLEGDAARSALIRSVRFAGARLVQTAYEATQASIEMTGNVIILLQLAANVLARPHEAAVQLLGLPLAEVS
jgi:aminoglycoside phosphotransferase (APT) family kinase protein